MAKTEVSANQPGNASSTSSAAAANPGEFPEGSQPLYPPLTVPEPYVSEKKKATISSCLKYRQVIDECRARRFNNDVFKPTKYFCPPDFAAKKSRAVKKATRKVVEKTDEEQAKAEEMDADEADTPKAKPAAAEDEDAKEAQEDEEEDTNVPKSDSDIDDYTANADFEDDEGGFDDGGMDNENDNHTF